MLRGCKKCLSSVASFYSRASSIIPVANRWWSFAAGLILELGAGNQYSFSAYSSSLRLHMGYTLAQTDLMGTTLNISFYFGILMSTFYDVFGPRPTCLLCSSLCFTGYFMIYLSAAGFLGHPTEVPFELMCFYFFLVGSGGLAMYSSGMATNVKNFPQTHRGKVVGIMAACFGMSAGLLGVVYKYFLGHNAVSYLLFLSIFLGLMPLVCSVYLNVVPEPTEPRSPVAKEDDAMSIQSAEGGLLLKGSAVADSCALPLQDDEDGVVETTGGMTMPLESAATGSSGSEDEEGDQREVYSTQMEERQPLDDDDDEGMTDEFISSPSAPPLSPIFHNTKPWCLFINLDFYLLVAIIFAGVGSGLVLINSIHEVVISYGGPEMEEAHGDSLAGSLVILISVFNTLGRISFGFMSDLTSRHISRTGWLFVAILTMGTAQLALVFANISSVLLYSATALGGFAHGAIFMVFPALASERFGTRFFAINFTMCQVGAALGSFVLATWVQSAFYNKYSIGGKGMACYEVNCFRPTFMITSLLCFAALWLSLILHRRTRTLYRLLEEEKDRRRALEGAGWLKRTFGRVFGREGSDTIDTAATSVVVGGDDDDELHPSE